MQEVLRGFGLKIFNQIKKHGGLFMSKFIIEIKLANGTTKQVKVYVDNRTAELLNQCDARVRQTYLEEEYYAQNRERAETRKHISLDTAMENGHDYISEEDSPMDKLLNLEDKAELEKALDKLTSRQREVFVMAVVDKLSFREISRRLGVNVRAVHDFYYAAQKKLKKFLE